MRLMELKGVFAAALTPLKPNLSIDNHALSSHCLDLLRRGVPRDRSLRHYGRGALLLCQGADKRPAQGDPKWGAGREDHPVGNGSNGITDTAELGKRQGRLGCSPFWPPRHATSRGWKRPGVVQFYREVIKRAEIPLILYHIPQLTEFPITLGVIKQLSRV